MQKDRFRYSILVSMAANSDSSIYLFVFFDLLAFSNDFQQAEMEEEWPNRLEVRVFSFARKDLHWDIQKTSRSSKTAKSETSHVQYLWKQTMVFTILLTLIMIWFGNLLIKGRSHCADVLDQFNGAVDVEVLLALPEAKVIEPEAALVLGKKQDKTKTQQTFERTTWSAVQDHTLKK